MAGRGPAPKDPAERRRRNADPVALTVVTAPDEPIGPELPANIDWPDQTIDWWETWRTSAQAPTFTPTDWAFLLDTAVLHMAFWDGDRSAASELRLRVAKFGATPEDRARLRISVGKPEAPAKTPAKKTPASRTRKAAILKAVGDD
jgi:hypothetical protein